MFDEIRLADVKTNFLQIFLSKLFLIREYVCNAIVAHINVIVKCIILTLLLETVMLLW